MKPIGMVGVSKIGDEVLTFLGLIAMMSIKKLPRIGLDFCCDLPPL